MRKHQRGFTLIEISIVLVIIGLLAGGILKGQQMIENAKYKAFVKEIEAYRTAFTTFQDTYRALPGDFNKMSRITSDPTFLTWGGNGNGVVGYSYYIPGTDTEKEGTKAICHLILAGLITGSCGPTPSNADQRRPTPVGGTLSGFGNVPYGNNVLRLKMYFSDMPAKVIKRLDEEFDDGQCGSGTITANTDWTAVCSGWPADSALVTSYVQI